MQETYGLYKNQLTDLCKLIAEAEQYIGGVLIRADEGEAFMKLVAIDATHATFGYTEGHFAWGSSGHKCSFKHYESRVPLEVLTNKELSIRQKTLLISSDLREIASERSEIHGEVNEAGGREVTSSSTVVYKPGNAVIIESEYVDFARFSSCVHSSAPMSASSQQILPNNQDGSTEQAKK